MNTSQATYTGQKTSDLLFKLFKHQPVMYNDALLENPRSATRKRTQANARNAMGKPIIVVDVDAGVNKRKRDGAPSVDLLSVADENRMNLSLGEENVADNGTYTSSVAMNGKKLRLPEPYAKDSFCADSVLSSAETRSVTGSGNGVYLSSTAKAQTPMFIHYLSLAKNGFPLDYVEEKQDRRCPFCFHDAVSTLFLDMPSFLDHFPQDLMTIFSSLAFGCRFRTLALCFICRSVREICTILNQLEVRWDR